MENSNLRHAKEYFDFISQEERNAIVTNHLKSVSKWDLKRIMCNVLDVDSYMDDEGLRKEFEKLVTSTR